MEEWSGARESRLQHDLDETLREQVLLWELVAAVTGPDSLTPSRLDALLAGRPLGPVPSERRRGR